MKNQKERRKYFKKEAREVLYSTWLAHIFAFLFLIFINLGVFNVLNTFLKIITSLISKTAFDVFSFCLTILGIFLLVPIYYGYYKWNIDFFANNNEKLENIFAAFSNYDMLKRAYNLFFYLSGKILICFSPHIAFVLLDYYYLKNSELNNYTSGFSVSVINLFFVKSIKFLVVATFIIGILYSIRYICSIYFSIKNQNITIKECFDVSKQMMNKHNYEFLILICSFFPLFILSLFTAGIMLVIFTVPYILLCTNSYFSYIENLKLAKPQPFEEVFENENKLTA